MSIRDIFDAVIELFVLLFIGYLGYEVLIILSPPLADRSIKKLGRKHIGIDLNPRYVEIAVQRLLRITSGMSFGFAAKRALTFQ